MLMGSIAFTMAYFTKLRHFAFAFTNLGGAIGAVTGSSLFPVVLKIGGFNGTLYLTAAMSVLPLFASTIMHFLRSRLSSFGSTEPGPDGKEDIVQSENQSGRNIETSESTKRNKGNLPGMISEIKTISHDVRHETSQTKSASKSSEKCPKEDDRQRSRQARKDDGPRPGHGG